MDITDPERPRRPVPAYALIISLAALAIPLAAPALLADTVSEYEPLVWLTALVPAFLFSYYRGWQGAATALAAGMAFLALGQVGSLVTGTGPDNSGLLLATVIIYVLLTLAIGWGAEMLHHSKEVAESAALTDPVTNLPNRRHTMLLLEREFEAARRGRDLTVALFDLDDFKTFNDEYGHAAGDQALKTFARVLDGVTRRMNLSGRIGGEEFVSVLGDADAEDAVGFVERVREALARNQPPRGRLTVSAGVAQYDATMRTPDDLLGEADRALYEAKRAGRDCVRIAG
jgi:diguanylate cyclase (GGDEF)-like protein